MKTIDALSKHDKSELKLIMKESDIPRVRMRSHAVILSSNGYSIEEISKIYEIDRDTVSSWLKRWEERSFNGLYDEKKTGRPPEVYQDIKKK